MPTFKETIMLNRILAASLLSLATLSAPALASGDFLCLSDQSYDASEKNCVAGNTSPATSTNALQIPAVKKGKVRPFNYIGESADEDNQRMDSSLN
jgi:hypothetical protein